MRFGIRRRYIGAFVGAFSAFQILLGVYSLDFYVSAAPVILALVFYGIATGLSLAPWGPSRMPVSYAAFNLSAVVSMCLLVTSVTSGDVLTSVGYPMWHVAAAATLLTITATRRRYGFAWAGAAFVLVQTVAWVGVPAAISIGIVGSLSWVGISHIISSGMARSAKHARRFAIAEREASTWRALQDAHVHERQSRLGQTNAMALTMLRTIERERGELSDQERDECLLLEAAIRDEIRGRSLLTAEVREEVMRARRRGVTVTLLDEGGIDDLDEDLRVRALATLAAAIAATSADTVIARTVTGGSATAITVVGLRSAADVTATALGQEALEEDEVDLWLEIPRVPDSSADDHSDPLQT
jgi:hypothetical protein